MSIDIKKMNIATVAAFTPLEVKRLWCLPMRKRIGLLTGFTLLFLVFLTGPVFALTISPVRMEISGDPGQTLNGRLGLFNEQDETKTFYSSAANFEAKGESGAPYFLPDTSSGLASWITVQESVTLKAGERKEVPYSIQIPPNTEAGGYFAAILWSTSPAQQGAGQVSIGGKLGMLILLSVTGELKEGGDGGLLDFKIDEDRRVVSALPITLVYRFSNEESERVKPDGEIKIKNLFGFTAATLDANPQKGNVLPRSIRKFSIIWAEKGQDKSVLLSSVEEAAKKGQQGFFAAAKNQWSNFALGPYKAELNLSYGKLSEAEATKTAKASFRFFVIPWQLLSIVIFILVLLGFGGWFGLKKYNRWIISKATQIQNK